MKTKEEIQKLSYAYSDKVNMSKDMTSLSIADAVTYGYNQCLKDIRKDWQNYTISEKSDFIEFLNKQD
jgi:hypothetical protein